LTENRILIAEKINAIAIEGGTNIYDAIYYAAGYLKEKAASRRKVIILISDNLHSPETNTSGPRRFTAYNCQEKLLENATALFSIRVSNRNWESVDAIRNLAEQTGSEMFNVLGPVSLKIALEEVITRLRTQYTIGFNPTNPGKHGSFHKLAIKFSKRDCCPNCKIAARSGYYSGVGVSPIILAAGVAQQDKTTMEMMDDIYVKRMIQAAGTIDLEAYDLKSIVNNYKTIDPDLHEIAFSTSTKEQRNSNGQPELEIDIRIDYSNIEFKKIENRDASNVHLAVYYADTKGNIVGSDWRKIEGLFSKETLDKAKKEGIQISLKIPLKVKNQIIKIVIYDEGSEKIGASLIRLKNSNYIHLK
jgi:hypothetical protein